MSPSVVSAAKNLLLGSLLEDHVCPAGTKLLARGDDLVRWRDLRLRAGIWAWARTVESPAGPRATIRNDAGMAAHGLNFVTQDPLSLTAHPVLTEAAFEAARAYGLHAPGIPAFAGASIPSVELEAAVAAFLGQEHVVLFPSGWAAAFGTLTALLEPHDHVVIDACAHAALHQGALAATPHVHRHAHLDLDAVTTRLRAIRRDDSDAAILVVTESLFPFEADTPDLRLLHEICRMEGAVLLVATGHDLGVTGPSGTGVLGTQEMLTHVDLVVGSFAKNLATNGGFLATRSAGINQLVRFRAGPHLTSNGLSPVQATVARESLRIVVSNEGEQLRANLGRAVLALRDACGRRALPCLGTNGALVPVMIGNERIARIIEAFTAERGLLATLIEDPLVPRGTARLGLHVTAAHRPEHAVEAADKIAEALAEVRAATGSASATG
jgi:glycine C-acetyltransferase